MHLAFAIIFNAMKRTLQIFGLVLVTAGLVFRHIDLLNALEQFASDGRITGGVREMIDIFPVFLIFAGITVCLIAIFWNRFRNIRQPEILKKKQVLYIAILIGIALRIIWIFSFDNQPFSDAAWFNQAAIEIAQNGQYAINGEKTAYRPIGYPSIISAIYMVLDYYLLYMKLFNLLLFILITFFIVKIYRELINKISIITGILLLSILPSSIAFTGLSLSEPLFTVLMLVSLLLFSKEKHVLTGISVGLMSLVRPVLLPFFVLYPLFRKQYKQAFIILAMSIVVIMPWAIRNYRVFGEFVPVSTNSGVNLYIGNNPEATGAYMEPPELDIENEALASKKYQHMAIEYTLRNPLQILRMIPRKLFYLFIKDNVGIDWTDAGMESTKGQGILHLLSFVIYYPILFMGLWGLFRGRKGNEFWFFIYFVALYMVFFGADRFDYPLMPILAMYAGKAITTFRDKPEPLS